MGKLYSIDFKIINWIQKKVKCPFMDIFMPIITRFGDKGIFYISLTIMMLLSENYKRIGVVAATSIIMGVVCGNLVLKKYFGRLRPYEINKEISILINKLRDYSFPSGHTLIAFEFAYSILFFNKCLGTYAIILAILIAFSRLYLYVHFPTDVIASIFLGFIFTTISNNIVNVIYFS